MIKTKNFILVGHDSKIVKPLHKFSVWCIFNR